MNNLTRGALFGAACAFCAIVAAGSAAAQTYPPGTNCQSLLPNLRAVCMNQIKQLNGGMNTNSTIVPSGDPNSVPAPGSVNSGNTVTPNGTTNPSGNTIPRLNSGTGAAGAPGTTGTGVGAGGTGAGGAGGGASGAGASGN